MKGRGEIVENWKLEFPIFENFGNWKLQFPISGVTATRRTSYSGRGVGQNWKLQFPICFHVWGTLKITLFNCHAGNQEQLCMVGGRKVGQ